MLLKEMKCLMMMMGRLVMMTGVVVGALIDVNVLIIYHSVLTVVVVVVGGV